MHSGGIGFDFFSPGGALPSIVNIALWEWLGYNMVIFYAALQAIDRSVLEAATVDGGERRAHRVQHQAPADPLLGPDGRALHDHRLAPAVHRTLILNTGSGSAVSSSWTPNMYAYTAAFSRNDFGLAAAASVLLALAAALLSFVVTRLTGRKGAHA